MWVERFFSDWRVENKRLKGATASKGYGSVAGSRALFLGKVGNIGFDGYIGTCILWIYRIYRRYIGGYFFMNIDISKINKNTLKFI